MIRLQKKMDILLNNYNNTYIMLNIVKTIKTIKLERKIQNCTNIEWF